MKRFKYGQNFSAINSSQFMWLTPLGTLEVAPGDTVSGRFTVQSFSDTTSKPIMNRTYMDTYAFYVPYRLLWDQWTDFIAGKTDDSPPVTDDLSDLLMERRINPSGECAQWNRRAYNLIWNKYFREVTQDEVPLDQAILPLQGLIRPSTFHESAFNHEYLSDQEVPVELEIDFDGETAEGYVITDALRTGFSQDRWQKTRDYYGDKYSDYLAALGVKTPWSIADEPELIGKASKDWNYNTTNATAHDGGVEPGETNVADPAGYFRGSNACRIRSTFTPEHGIILMLGIARMDIPNVSGSVSPHLAKVTRERYYSPEYETERLQTWNGPIWGETAGGNPQTRRFEDYRKPSNQYGQAGAAIDPEYLYVHTWDDATAEPHDYKNLTSSAFANLFTGNMGNANQVHYTSYNEVRMVKRSPVRPPAFIKGVS